MTRQEPAARRARAQAERVAPVVHTSSTRRALRGAGSALQTRGGCASRCQRLLPTCRPPPSRRRHGLNATPANSATATAISSAGSKPLHRQRPGPGGTGTTASADSARGRARSIAPAATSARASRRPNLSPCTTRRATPPNGEAESARSTPGGPGSTTRGADASSDSQRSQSKPSPSGREPHAAQSGGARSETSSARGPAILSRGCSSVRCEWRDPSDEVGSGRALIRELQS
jgi:hypothetical protein